MTDYAAYAAELRHELHQCPEIGFDLPQTLAVVRRELNAMGIEFTEKYARSSIVGVINPEKTQFTIGIRADMDALPIEEKSSNPFKSKNPGKMHACGHDAHTATLLAVARQLNDMKDQIRCRVKLLFTPAEEYITPGCKEMVEGGVMDDIDCVIACHVDNDLEVGSIYLNAGGYNANSMGFTVEFFGTPAHAIAQQNGVDAIHMAVQAYMAMEMMVAKEIPATTPKLLNIGMVKGGVTNNIICNYCKMFGSCRSFDDDVAAKMERRIKEICQGVAAMAGGRAEVTINKFLPYVINNETMTERMRVAAAKVIGEDHITEKLRPMGGEDFAFLGRVKPGVMFRLGTRGDNPDTHNKAHNDKFDVDERCFAVSIPIFVQFVLDNMDGISFEGRDGK